MYGWRARIGYITPSNTLETPAYEFFRMAPDGVILVGACLNVTRVTDDAVERAWQSVEEVARGMARYALDYLIIGGAPLAYVKGPGADRELGRRVTEACGVPAVSEMTAAVDALRTLGVKTVAVASPFIAEINAQLARFLESEGFAVGSITSLGKDSNPEITMLPLRASYEMGVRARREAPAADGIYITCPRWPVSPNIEPLEQDLGLPVVASMQAALWAALRHLGLHAPVPGYGRLLRQI